MSLDKNTRFSFDINVFSLQILKLLCVSRNGLNENELLALVPELTWSIWTPIFNALCDQLILKYQTGLVMPAHEQVGFVFLLL